MKANWLQSPSGNIEYQSKQSEEASSKSHRSNNIETFHCCIKFVIVLFISFPTLPGRISCCKHCTRFASAIIRAQQPECCDVSPSIRVQQPECCDVSPIIGVQQSERCGVSPIIGVQQSACCDVSPIIGVQQPGSFSASLSASTSTSKKYRDWRQHLRS